MSDVPEESRTRILTPARVLIGSLIAGAGLTVLGFLAGGSSASAEEQAPPPGVVSSLVSNVTGEAGKAVGSVTSAVAPALPAPVQQVVSAVVTPVTDTVDQVVDQSPVASVVEPVASTVDEVVAQVPVVRDVLPAAPVTAVTQPVTGAVDQVVSDAAGVVDSAVAPLVDQPQPPSAPGTSVSDGPGSQAVADAAPAALVGSSSTAADRRLLASWPGALGSFGLPGSFGNGQALPGDDGPGGVPGGVPGGSLPAGGASGSSGGAGPGAPVPGAGAAPDGFLLPASVRSGLSGAPADDTVPASPVADHDISPD